MLEKSKHDETKKSAKASAAHPSHSESLPRLKRAQGQIEGVMNMINDGRYCPDIIIQLRAVVAALKTVEGQVIERHLHGCINSAIRNRDQKDLEKKINELTSLYVKGL